MEILKRIFTYTNSTFYATVKNALSIFTAESGQKFNVGPLSKVFNASFSHKGCELMCVCVYVCVNRGWSNVCVNRCYYSHFAQ